MCNAMNHPPGCRCGWGGDGHLGQGGGYVYESQNRVVRFESSHTKENFCRPTKCPVCSQKPVYFIRHNGGSFWVDEPGWPWEKHACFAQDTAHKRLADAADRVKRPQPCLVVECQRRPDKVTDLVIVEGERGRRYLVQVKSGIELYRLAGELVILSLPDNKMCHPLVPGNSVVKIVSDGTPPMPPAPPVVRVAPRPLPPPASKPTPKIIQTPTPKSVLPPVSKPVPGNAAKAKNPQPVAAPVLPQPLTEDEVARLLIQVNSGCPAARAEAIATLAKYRILKATDAITRRLFDIDPSVRVQAAAACTRFGFAKIANQIVQTAQNTPEQTFTTDVIAALQKDIGAALRDSGTPYRQYHAVVLVGQLRLASFLPELVQHCHSSKPVALRRAVVETLWRISVVEALPLLLFLSVDPDSRVRRYAAAALADLEEYTMSQVLLTDPDEEVREQARRSFIDMDSPVALTSPFRVPVKPSLTVSPLPSRDMPVWISVNRVRDLISPLLKSSESRKQKAGLAALLWAGGAESYTALSPLAQTGCSTAIAAIKEHFGVEPKRVERVIHEKRKPGKYQAAKLKFDLTYPSVITPDTYRNPPRRSMHPVFRRPFPIGTVLVIGGDGREEAYQRSIRWKNITLFWKSGFAPDSLTVDDLWRSDAVVLVSNAVSFTTYQRLLELLNAVGSIPCAFSQTPSLVSIAQTLRTLLSQRDGTGTSRPPAGL